MLVGCAWAIHNSVLINPFQLFWSMFYFFSSSSVSQIEIARLASICLLFGSRATASSLRSSLPATETNPERKMAIVLCPLQHTCKFFLPTLNWGGNSFWGCCWGVISTSRKSKSSWKFETKILLFAGKCLNWGQWSLWKEELRKGFQGEVIRSGCRG